MLFHHEGGHPTVGAFNILEGSEMCHVLINHSAGSRRWDCFAFLQFVSSWDFSSLDRRCREHASS